MELSGKVEIRIPYEQVGFVSDEVAAAIGRQVLEQAKREALTRQAVEAERQHGMMTMWIGPAEHDPTGNAQMWVGPAEYDPTGNAQKAVLPAWLTKEPWTDNYGPGFYLAHGLCGEPEPHMHGPCRYHCRNPKGHKGDHSNGHNTWPQQSSAPVQVRESESGTISTILRKLRDFHASLSRTEFYEFYELMTSLASPSCGDKVMAGGELINLKKIVRRLRITAMAPRFNVDYAEAYTGEEAKSDLLTLEKVYRELSPDAKNSVAKVMGALKIVIAGLPACAAIGEAG